MPPTSQGARLLAAQRVSTGNASLNASASMAPVDAAASGRGRSSGLREPSLADEDVEFDFRNVDIPPPPLSSLTARHVQAKSPRGFGGGRPPQSPPSSRSKQAARDPAAHAGTASPGGRHRQQQQQQAAAFSHSASRSAVHNALQETTRLSTQKDASDDFLKGIRSSPRPTRRNVIVPDGAAYPTAMAGLTAIGTKRSSTSPSKSMHSPALKALNHSGFDGSQRIKDVPWGSTTTPQPASSSFRDPRERLPFSTPFRDRLDGASVPPGKALPTGAASPPSPTASTMAAQLQPPKYHDYSGFTNSGNTCYAASVLTMLLRQQPLVDGLREFVLAYGDLKRKLIRREEVPVTPPSLGSPVNDELAEPDRDFLDFMGDVTPKQVVSDDIDASDRLWLALQGNPAVDPPLTAAPEPTAHHTSGVDDEAADPWDNDPGKSAYQHHGSPPAAFRTVETEVRVPLCPLHIALDAAAVVLATEPASVRYGLSVDAIANAMAVYAMDGSIGEFFDGTQHDAHEFFVALVSCLEREALIAMRRAAKREQRQRATMLKRLRDADDDPTDAVADKDFVPPLDAAHVWINKLVQGTMLNVVACRRSVCGMQQVSKETFVNVSVTIPPQPSAPGVDGPDTESLVHASLAVDQLDGYKCDKCGSTARQFQGGCFHAAPPLLVVQWKRFSVHIHNGQCVVDKNSAPVCVSQRMSVVSRTEANAVAGTLQQSTVVKRTSYELKAVVLHQGMSLDAGHYLTLFREATPKLASSGNAVAGDGQHLTIDGPRWMIANDSRVDEITPHQLHVATHNATLCYLALYEAVGTVQEVEPAGATAGAAAADRAGDNPRHWAVELPPLGTAEAAATQSGAPQERRGPTGNRVLGPPSSPSLLAQGRSSLSQLADAFPLSPSSKPPRLAARVSSLPTTPRTPLDEASRYGPSASFAFEDQPLPPPLAVDAEERPQASQGQQRRSVSVSSDEWLLTESQVPE